MHNVSSLVYKVLWKITVISKTIRNASILKKNLATYFTTAIKFFQMNLHSQYLQQQWKRWMQANLSIYEIAMNLCGIQIYELHLLIKYFALFIQRIYVWSFTSIERIIRRIDNHTCTYMHTHLQVSYVEK